MHFEDIFNAVTHLEGEEQGSSSPEKLLIELKDVVVEELSHLLVDSDFDLNSFKSVWVTRITSVMTELNLVNKNKRITRKPWERILNSTSVPVDIIDEVRSSSGVDSTSKTSSSSNRRSTSSCCRTVTDRS
ncbi:hypothetical protein G6F57_014162 [Rhizopus arrhizus]|uniref:Uncharacterized protein n=1 Tax=Rhizopus oryzae TaxID=64495 RepID=A0A9P6WXN8_RHIOR|nr:hypothetical protein G6F24_012791 [Rhizopus arrhizus]KAG1391899.1 hypothetical protein G6F58_012617 [Rhizopus delemar]KAG0772643.1 hypothetical protein G6F22_015565 [Rhizopus arrhizus]KAG0781053.1 hypothetical protein G6F21_011847 [Rhizopus arrhizus]KAG0805164.1 hypothetical protein G6F20_012131 [Rhizopus arrhizus]